MTPTNSNDSKTSAPHSWYGYSTGNTNKDGYINPLPTSGILEYSGKAFYGKMEITMSLIPSRMLTSLIRKSE
ncbi:Uncharacterised protein [Actinobacillus equuli]|nr:Uncharacterised protein [Actinobacillus equuli]